MPYILQISYLKSITSNRHILQNTMVIWRTKLKKLTNIFSAGVKTIQNSNEYSIAREFLLSGFHETVNFVRSEFLPQKRVFELSEKRQMEVKAIQRQIRSKRLQLNHFVSTHQSINDENLQTPTVKDMVSGPPLPLKQETSTAEASSTANVQQRQIRMKETSNKPKEDENVDGSNTKSSGENGDNQRGDDGATTTTSDAGQ